MKDTTRRRHSYRGTIQGVGFRPCVYRCAAELGLSGFVQNRRSCVVAEVQGPADRVEAYPGRLRQLLPSAARITEERVEELAPVAEDCFRIAASVAADYDFPPIPPDLAICPDCRRELFDPSDRRYLYPFVSCTQCGPRYTIVESTPFDRETTSMVDFPLCAACRTEYEDPGDRRFHAQASSCPDCGPRLHLVDAAGRAVAGEPLISAVEALRAGAVVAVQGLGGFHLAADPRNTATMQRLRRDKERERKPFALMVRDLEVARRLCAVDDPAAAELASERSPILILPARDPEGLRLVSDTGTLGILLPYTALHLLLFYHPTAAPFDCLVMTSANLKGQPMVTVAQQALEKLAGTAELFLCHDRRILFRADDSVLRPSAYGPAFCQIRRSRGCVPRLVSLPRGLDESVLAVGGDLKNAPALGLGRDLYLGAFVGDLEDPETYQDFRMQVQRLLELYGLRPQRVAYDPHPLYVSHAWAAESGLLPAVAVQHHHAHVLSVMAEHGLEEAIGLAFDGTGYGSDGTVWGGEFLHATRRGFVRMGHFGPFRLPGGESAVLHPIRIALALLIEAGEDVETLLPDMPGTERRLLEEIVRRSLHAPLTTSVGRIFDAAAALLAGVGEVSYEAEGPIRLEGMAAGEAREAGIPGARGVVALTAGLPFRLDAAPLIAELARRRRAVSPARLALEFHVEIASAAVKGALEMREQTGLNDLCLSGGVFQNVLLREILWPRLHSAGFRVYTNEQVPPGDGGLAIGQAYFEP
ncbi:MAG: carbamoyltransferase HypF [Spirochaetales bacterium]|nr:carbamoyltransferase HypF [Spirochaetales bacterium]